ncbi:hypothetical protein HY404_03520 [Candidatus Microgenomates bacterium]|nr:hypothetical protein [Candidatus Microgenomates bacterium]
MSGNGKPKMSMERKNWLSLLGVASVTLLEACSSGRPPQEQIAMDFVNALSNGDSNKAMTLVAPDLRRDQSIQEYVTQMAKQLKGCKVEAVTVRESIYGALMGAAEQASVTFKDLCGSGEVYGSRVKFSSMMVALDKTKGENNSKYYINPSGTMPMADAASLSPRIQAASQNSLTEPSPTKEILKSNQLKALPFRIETSKGRLFNRYGPYTTVQEDKTQEEGWKWVTLLYGFENTGKDTVSLVSLSLANSTIGPVQVLTQEGFQYSCGSFGSDIGQVSIPPKFRLIGTWHYGAYGGVNEASFGQTNCRISGKTTPTILQVPNFTEIDFKKGLVDINSFKFPTDLPDSSFKELVGTSFSTPNKGRIDFLEVQQKLRPSNDGKIDITLKLRFKNDNIGDNQTFNLLFPGIFATDGIFYETSTASAYRYEYLNITVPPGGTKEGEVKLYMPRPVEGKLIVDGDLKEIFNLRQAAIGK